MQGKLKKKYFQEFCTKEIVYINMWPIVKFLQEREPHV
jgi:hypothetical protein